MINTIFIAAFILFFIFMFSKSRPSVSSDEAKKLVADGAKLVDVRSPGEYAGRKIPGAVNIPVEQLPRRLKELGAKDKPIVLYCQSGMRSGRALGILKNAGFTQVHNLGGINRW